ncbi:MAG: hypothetical protein V4689_19625 [Verrucomicrobiota bacterium]
MYLKIMAGICAASTTITAIFCIWIAVNLVTCDRKMGEVLKDAPSWNSSSAGPASSPGQMEKERQEIERQLNSRSRK